MASTKSDEKKKSRLPPPGNIFKILELKRITFLEKDMRFSKKAKPL